MNKMSGPCVVCGGIDYPLSMGGPSICPACDCGYTQNPRNVRKVMEENSRLRAALKEVHDFVQSVETEDADDVETMALIEALSGRITAALERP